MRSGDILRLCLDLDTFTEQLREASYLYADTRIPSVRLYDHLRLTAGIATAMVVELRHRGWTAEAICGLPLPDEELRGLARLCGWIHDVGKARLGETEYRLHVQRGVEYAQEWLSDKDVSQELREIIIGAIARHHLRDGPRTPLEKIICLADSYASAGDRPELARATTVEALESTMRGTQALERELFGQNAPVCLLLGDTDAIKNYAYETNVLPEIRGGSQLLQDCEKEIQDLFHRELAKECLIYCSGGGFLAVVPASRAAELKERIENLYREKTILATITVVCSEPIGYADIARGLQPYDETSVNALKGEGVAGDLLFSHFEAPFLHLGIPGTPRNRRKNFGELVAKLSGDLQQAKRQKELVPFVEALPIQWRCESCGRRPAVERDDVRGERLCMVCHKKRKTGREQRQDFAERFAKWVEEKKNKQVPRKGPDDLDTLAAQEGKIALLYADGNNMGQLLQLAPSPATYVHISETLTLGIQEALFEALWQTFGEQGLREAYLPFEIIALGGDDVVVIVPTSKGWTLTWKFLELFESERRVQTLAQEFKERVGTPIHLSMSAGLAIADVKYPVAFLFRIAEGLLKEAKRLAREIAVDAQRAKERGLIRTDGSGAGTFCHLWLRAPVISEDAKALLGSLYERSMQHQEVHLTARPYTVAQARVLEQAARTLNEAWSASQRRSLAEALEKGVYVSLNYALYQVARSRGHQTALLDAFRTLRTLANGASSASDQGFWFWDQQQNLWRTALLDALELLELGAIS